MINNKNNNYKSTQNADDFLNTFKITKLDNYLKTFSMNDRPCDAPNCLFNVGISSVINMDSAISASLGDAHRFRTVTSCDKSGTWQHLSHSAKCA